MKLSEAIREGAKWPDVHGPIFNGECCCAIGGVYRAAGVKSENISGVVDFISSGEFDRRVDLLRVACPPCPVSGCGYWTFSCQDLISLVPHLFEGHRWSKVAIAEFIETVEKRLGAEAARKEPSGPVEVTDQVTLAECGIV